MCENCCIGPHKQAAACGIFERVHSPPIEINYKQPAGMLRGGILRPLLDRCKAAPLWDEAWQDMAANVQKCMCGSQWRSTPC